MVFSAPSTYIGGLKNYNFSILNLANNHALDQGLPGINDTRDSLDQSNILHEGTGDNLDEAWTPAVVTANGLKICFVGASYASANDNGKTTNDYVARMEDTARLKTAINTAKGECDFVVATMHGGVEYTRTPNELQVSFAHTAIDDGADIVIGAHPHWVQTVEKYCPLQSSPPNLGGVAAAGGRGGISIANNLPPPPAAQGTPPVPGGETATCANPKYIFYSLGNFIFDQNFSEDTMQGLTLKITVSKTACSPSPPLGEMSRGAGQRGCTDDLQGTRLPAKLDSIELLPVVITNSQPRPATSDESKKILDKISETQTILTP